MSDAEKGAKYRDLFETPKHDHSAECSICPICAGLSVLRKTKPEVVEHLTVAVRELVVAAGLLLEEASEVVGAAKDEATEEKDTRVRRIDIV